MTRQWAKALASRGSIRLGTLEAFQKEEAYSPGIGDAGEGTRVHVSGPLWSNPGDVDIPGLKLVGVPPGMIQLSNVAIANQANALILCLAEHIGATGLATEYDTVVEVSRPQVFLDAITAALVEIFPDIQSLGLAKCIYAERETQLNANVPKGDDSWFRKPPRFASQSEYRAGWWRPGLGSDAICLEVAELCELVRILPDTSKPTVASMQAASVGPDGDD
jgi:hypothetical protein